MSPHLAERPVFIRPEERDCREDSCLFDNYERLGIGRELHGLRHPAMIGGLPPR